MTYLLEHLHTSQNTLRRIDIAPIAARYMAVIVGFQALLLAGNYRRLPSAAQKIRGVVRTLIKAQCHNHHVEMKWTMLQNPDWRARILLELGGSRKLKLWIKALMRKAGQLPKRRVPPQPEQPEWLQTPERIAVSEALKAHARYCAKACLPTGTARDPYRMDREGQFRLAPLPRISSSQPRQAVIYTQMSIGDYNYNAVPIMKPSGFGPASVSPFEFIAAAKMDKTDVIPTKAENRRPRAHPLDISLEDRSQMGKASPFVWDDVDEEDGEEDFLPLPDFLGLKIYMNLFYKPP